MELIGFELGYSNVAGTISPETWEIGGTLPRIIKLIADKQGIDLGSHQSSAELELDIITGKIKSEVSSAPDI